MFSPPLSLLPPGAARWDVVNEVAIRLGRDVRTILSLCRKGLLHSYSMAGGYLGIWVAVTVEGAPVDGPKVESYREHRSNVSRQREARLRAAREAAAQASPKKKPRSRSASRAQ
jgi:hypothetical protein